MRKYVRISGFLGISLLVLSLFPHLTYAAQIENEDNAKKNVTITNSTDDDLYVSAEERVIVKGDVNGDVFVSGGEVTIEGNVTRDIFAAGGLVSIKGNVEGSVVVAGGDISIDGDVGRTLITAGGTVRTIGTVSEDVVATGGTIVLDGQVNDDVRAFGGLVRVNKNVGGDVFAFGGSVSLVGNVGGDVHVAGDDVQIRSASIKGDLVSYSGSPTLADGVTIGGQKREVTVTKEVSKFGDSSNSVFGFGVLGGFGMFLRLISFVLFSIGFIILGLFIQKLAPVKLESTLQELKTPQKLFTNFAVGSISVIVVAIVCILLAFSIVGWPLLLFIIGLAIIAKSVAIPIGGYWIGKRVMKMFAKQSVYWVDLSVGVILLQALMLIPCFGGLLNLFVTFSIFGALAMMKYNVLWKKTGSKK